jgi:invasion protein IalB
MLVFLFLSGPHAAGQEQSSGSYRIKPSEVAVPPGVKLGGYQRVTRPFENWTLVCDENLEARQKVCNVTQIIESQPGQLAFSWSLAATKEGKPYMILRTASSMKRDAAISLKFEGREKPIDVLIDGCNEQLCVGMLPVGPIMRAQIAKDAVARISYPTTDGKVVSVAAPLKGLSTAVQAIN